MAHFLKHLTAETMALKKLLIPPEFVSKCGRVNLTNPIVLEPTVGGPLELEVELYEDASGFWLRNGWQELADKYSLRQGHYLVFEFKSYSRFKLVMLGENGLDLEFPASRFVNIGSNGNREFPEFHEAEEEEKTVNTDSVEFLGTSLVKGMHNSNGGGGRQQARRQSGENGKLNECTSARKRRTTDVGGKRKADREAPRRGRGSREKPVAKRPFSSQNDETNENQDFMESAEEEDYVDASYVKFLGSLSVKKMNNNNGGGPKQPAQPPSAESAMQNEFMSAGKGSTANGGENSKVNQEGPQRNEGSGRPFGRDNAETPHIPSMAEQQASNRPSSSRCDRPAATPADGFTSQPDFLQVIVTKSSTKIGRQKMLGGFVERHITNWNGKMVELNLGEETWSVKIMSHRGVPTLCEGWRRFVRDNSLNAGDTCIFVATATEDVLGVHILRSF